MDIEQNNRIHLTKHEKKVLHKLMEDARVSDSSIAREMGISSQAILKIRHKLEDSGLVKGYKPIIDYKKLGINVMAWVVLKVLPDVWSEYSDSQIRDKIRHHPYVVWSCEIPEAEATHILLYGFRSLNEMDRHFIRVKTKLSKIFEIIKINPFSVEQIIKNSPTELFSIVLDDKDFFVDKLFSDSKYLSKK
jgi:Lrp/AsnC family leucine-responsive transcriptional regulator